MSESKSSPDNVLWSPHPAQARFLSSGAYEALYGGAAGGGKTDALLFGGLRYVHVPGYAALMLRRTFPELKEVMDRAAEVFPSLGARWKGDDKRWEFPSGATFEMGYCDSYDDIMRYQGRQFAYIAWDEIGQVPEERWWTKLMAWNRTPVPGIQKMMRCSANPGGPGHAWLRKRFINPCKSDGTPYVDPLTGFTRAFVASTVRDNPTIMENDPQYVRQMELLPEILKRQLLYGDWNAGTGLALEELDARIHIVRPFEIPEHWVHFGSFDWGYRHPFSFGWYVNNEDGDVYKVDTVTGQRLLPWAIAQLIKEYVPTEKLAYIVAGGDAFNEHVAQGETTKTIAEYFQDEGMILQRANNNRINGLQVFRDYTSWRGRGPGGEDIIPRYRLFDTHGNRITFDQLEGIVTDPKRPEDTLKVNADEQGQGGDDHYDCDRYALASRPTNAPDVVRTVTSAWDPHVVAQHTHDLWHPKPDLDDLTELPEDSTFGQTY